MSATTRKPRTGEQNGVNYFFITKEEFKHIWNGYWNAELSKLKVGDSVYLKLAYGFEKRNIAEINIDEDGEVLCVLSGEDLEYGSGELYKSDFLWRD